MNDHKERSNYASPPCSLHEADPAYSGILAHDPQAALEVARWRKSERTRLIDKRLSTAAARRTEAAANIAAKLDREIGDLRDRTIGFYWPFRGEPDLRGWAQGKLGAGARIALPVVIAKGQPLEFRSWKPGEKLEKGVWNIPVPAAGELVSPDIVIAPLVGFDPAGYRLGYGGGFYDRTLAAMPSKPLTIGVGFEFQRLPTIFPQWHDVPMNSLVIERVS
ncbi:MAG: 5-formyltetrahydrofolate cyclo-ligase [Rhizobiaceae bacterium]|nr:5-formyltetrahydrofolate cyclo-ligase [Rhizobiaceae bacterium]